jgi:hypothetical protein
MSALSFSLSLSLSFMVLGFRGLRSFTSFGSFASSGSFFLRCLLALAGGGSAWLESVTVAGASSWLFILLLLLLLLLVSFLIGVRMPSQSESEAAWDKGDDEKSTASALCSGAVMVAWSLLHEKTRVFVGKKEVAAEENVAKGVILKKKK